jgi:hypothetical protein
MFDPTFEVPEELKERVAVRLKTSGALKQISRKIKVGMTAAIHELRDNPSAKSSLELQIWEDKSKSELAALQSIYEYLSERGLAFTLGCLLEEAGIQREEVAYDLIELVTDDFEEEESSYPSEYGKAGYPGGVAGINQ